MKGTSFKRSWQVLRESPKTAKCNNALISNVRPIVLTINLDLRFS